MAAQRERGKELSMEAVQMVQAEQQRLTIFSYEGVRLKESCWIEGKPYFTRRAIAEFLEYPNPGKDPIGKILTRNPYIKQFCTTLKMRVVQSTGTGISTPPNLGGVLPHQNNTEITQYEREMEVDVYDPIGLQLIIFESHQPKAKQYKIAVAHMVYAYVKGTLRPYKWDGDISSALAQIISIPSGPKRKLKVVALAKELGKSLNVVYRMAKKMNGENLKTHNGKPRKTKSDAYSFTNRPEYHQVKEYLEKHPAAKGTEIKAALGIPVHVSRVQCWIRHIKSHNFNNR